MDIAFASATQLAAEVRERRIGSRELLEHYLARVERHDRELHAVVVRDFDRARHAADAADAQIAKGQVLGPLHGVPMTIKESFDLEGLPTCWGSPAHRRNIATSTAVAARRLQAAGAVIFGKTNVSALLADWQSHNEVYGTTSNPWDLSRTCGGSSGGSAAVLAAGLTGFELGSDIGGSLRVPAHYCGVYAHKPTFGIVPPAGHWLGPGPRTDISVGGPMARSAVDLELGLSLIAGPDGAEARAMKLALPPCPHDSLRGFRVAVMLDARPSPVDAEIQAAVDAVARHLASQGATVSWEARPDIDFDKLAQDVPLLVRSTTAGRMPQAEYEHLLHERMTLDPADDGPTARFVRGVTASHRDWLQANIRRHAMQQAWERFFGEWDLLICPPAISVAFPHDLDDSRKLERLIEVNGRPQSCVDQMFWAGLAGLSYLPATVAPAGRSKAGLPIGVQIIGPAYGDLSCIALARHLEHSLRGFQAPPQFAD